MAIVIDMPKLSDTMTEGKILSWLKREGDEVEPGEVLAEVESDKANMELEAYDPGFLRKILVADGDSCPVGAPIAIVTEDPDEDIGDVLAEVARTDTAVTEAAAPAVPATPVEGASALDSGNGARTTSPARARAADVISEPAEAPMIDEPTMARAPQPAVHQPAVHQPAAVATTTVTRRPDGPVLASPLALRMAAEYGLKINEIVGSGPEGRVVKRDIERALRDAKSRDTATSASVVSTAPPPFEPVALGSLPDQSFEDVPLSSMRKVIANRLTQSMREAPHFYLTMEVDMKNSIDARQHVNSMDGIKVSFNDFVVKATALALTRNPALNAAWHGNSIRYFKSIDIGIAVALPDGLLTPVVRACQLKGLARISQEIKYLAQKAHAKKLKPEEFQGGTFTISNLGMFGVKHFTAVINPPEACILAVSAISEVPVVESGQVVPGSRMDCTLSCDHRVVDGAQAAHFMRDLKAILENPVSLAL